MLIKWKKIIVVILTLALDLWPRLRQNKTNKLKIMSRHYMVWLKYYYPKVSTICNYKFARRVEYVWIFMAQTPSQRELKLCESAIKKPSTLSRDFSIIGKILKKNTISFLKKMSHNLMSNYNFNAIYVTINTIYYTF